MQILFPEIPFELLKTEVMAKNTVRPKIPRELNPNDTNYVHNYSLEVKSLHIYSTMRNIEQFQIVVNTECMD